MLFVLGKGMGMNFLSVWIIETLDIPELIAIDQVRLNSISGLSIQYNVHFNSDLPG